MIHWNCLSSLHFQLSNIYGMSMLAEFLMANHEWTHPSQNCSLPTRSFSRNHLHCLAISLHIFKFFSYLCHWESHSLSVNFTPHIWKVFLIYAPEIDGLFNFSCSLRLFLSPIDFDFTLDFSLVPHSPTLCLTTMGTNSLRFSYLTPKSLWLSILYW